MTINVVPNPLTTEPQSLGKPDAPWTSVHANQGHLSYLRLHAFTEDLAGHSAQVQELQNLYGSILDDNSMSTFSSILHMRLDGLYVGNARVVLNSEIDTVNSKLAAFFGDVSSQHLGIRSHYDYLEDGWDSLVQIVARIKNLASLQTDIDALATRVTDLETNGTSSSGSSASVLADLTDVAISTSTLSTNLFLKYTGSSWENVALAWGDLSSTPDLSLYLTQSDTDALYTTISTHNGLATTVSDHTTRIGNLESATPVSALTTSGTLSNINVANGSGGLTSTDWLISSSGQVTMAGHIIPDTNAAYDLGNAEYKIRHLFLSDNSITMSPATGTTYGDSSTHISFDAMSGGLVSKTEYPYTMAELESQFGSGAMLVLEALINNQEYNSTDPKTGKTIRITGDDAYWTTATGLTTTAHDSQTLTYCAQYTLNKDNILLTAGTGVAIAYSEGTYTVGVDSSIATTTYVDNAVGAIVDADTTYTASAPLSIDSTTNDISIDPAVYTYTGGSGITVSPTTTTAGTLTGNEISLNTNNFLTTGALAGYQESLDVADSTELSISGSNVLSLNALRPYRPGYYANIPVDGQDIPVSQQRGSGTTSRDGALLPSYSVLENVLQSVTTEYTRGANTITASHGPLPFDVNPQRVVSTPNTSMYFVSILGDQRTEADKGDEWVEGIFTDFHDEMINAGWVAPTASELYDQSAEKFTLGGTVYVDGDRVNHPAVHVVANSGSVTSLQIPADDIIDEALIVRAYTGTASSGAMLGNVFLYTLDQNITGLDTGTRKVLAIGPVMKYQEQGRTDGNLNTKISPLYSVNEADSPQLYALNPTSGAYYSNITAPVLTKLSNDSGTGVLEVGYYIVWDSTVMDPDAGAVPHGANLRFHRDATIFTEEEGALLHVSYQNAWLPSVASHELARLPNNVSLQSLYVNHLEVTSNSSALFTNGMQIVNTDVCNLVGGSQSSYDHDTMDSGFVVVTSGSLVTVTNNLGLQEQVKKIDTFSSLYYDASSDQWRITKGTSGSAVAGTIGTYVDTSGTLTQFNHEDGRPTDNLRGSRIDANSSNSERILTESDISSFVTASTLSNYATASSLSSLSTTVSNLSLTTNIPDLEDVNIVAASLSEGQYLKWDGTNDEWVAGSASDFTTGVTSVNGQNGAAVLNSGHIAEDSNLYYTDGRVGAYLTANSYATEGYVDTAVTGLASTTYVDTAVTGLASTTYVDDAVTSLVDGAPNLLNTLDELANALGDDENFATSTAASIAAKADNSQTITGGTGIVTAGSLGAGVTVSLGTINSDIGTFGSATEVPQLTVDAYGRVTAVTLSDVHNFSGAYADLSGKPTLFDGAYGSLTGAPTLSTVATTGVYADLTDAPTLFDGAYASLTGAPTLFDGAYGSLTGAPTLSAVATSGDYADLSGAPTLFDGAYASLTGLPTLFDGTYASLTGKPSLFDGTYASLTGAPTLSTVATSGDYADLSGAPTLFDGAYASLSGLPTLFDGAYGSLTGAPTLSTVATSGAYADLSGLPTLFDGTYGSLSGKPTLFDGAYGSLSGLPTLFDGTYASLTGAPTLSTVATSGDYADLTGAPTLFDGAYASLSGLPTLFDGTYASLTGKPTLFDGTYASLTGAPTLSTVATSGDYADLTGAPTLFDGAYASLSGLPTLFDGTYASLTGKPTLFDGTYASLTGAPTLATVATSGNYSDISGTPDLTGFASTTYVDSAVSGLVNGAPGLLNTLDELAQALGDDENFATTVSNSIAAKQDELTAGDNVAITGSTLSVDLSSYATAATIASTYLTQANASTTYAGATSTASSITALGGRIDDVEAFTVSIADNSISINGGTLAAATLSASLRPSMSTELGISSLATAASLNAVKSTVDGRVNVTGVGTGLTLSGGTLSATVDLSGYSTSTQISDTYLTQSDASSNYAGATSTASSITALGGRIDDVEAFTVNIAGNSIGINGGVIAAATLSDSLKTAMSDDLNISSLATAASLSAVKTTVDARINATTLGQGLTLSSGSLATTVDLSTLATAATLSNYVLTSTANTAYAGATTTASSLTALDGRLDTIEGDYLTSGSTLSGANISGNISIAGNSISLAGGTISAASLSASLSSEMSDDLSISSLASNASVTSVSNRVTTIENDYVTSATTLASARLDNSGMTLAGLGVSLGGTITASSLSEALTSDMTTDLGIANLATNATVTAVSNRVTTIENDYVTSASTLASARLDNKGMTLAGLGVNLGGTITASSLSEALSSDMATDIGLSSYATTSALTTGLATKQPTLSVAGGSKISLSSNVLDVDLSDYAVAASYTDTTSLTSLLNAKQDNVSAGSNITITGATLSVATSLVDEISLNTAKTGITATQAGHITANNAKVGYTDALSRAAISATGDVSYNNSTGAISYTSQWTTSSGKITTENVVLVPGHVVEVFDMGADLTNSPDFTLDAGAITGSVDRVVDCGILDQRRLF